MGRVVAIRGVLLKWPGLIVEKPVRAPTLLGSSLRENLHPILLAVRRPIPPEGPPPEAPEGPPPGTSEPCSWHWVWVPDRPDVRDRDQPSYRAERESVAGSESIASRGDYIGCYCAKENCSGA